MDNWWSIRSWLPVCKSIIKCYNSKALNCWIIMSNKYFQVLFTHLTTQWHYVLTKLLQVHTIVVQSGNFQLLVFPAEILIYLKHSISLFAHHQVNSGKIYRWAMAKHACSKMCCLSPPSELNILTCCCSKRNSSVRFMGPAGPRQRQTNRALQTPTSKSFLNLDIFKLFQPSFSFLN